jgi:hypothetical protein
VRGCRRIKQTHNTSVEIFSEFTEIAERASVKAEKYFFKPAGVRRINYQYPHLRTTWLIYACLSA